jgi:pimeloyl-ACP methyl ester carboxylesterase
LKPVTFNGCLGWLHMGNSRRGVVLCEPLGHEGLWTHKLVRALAERLSDEGMWVLRFNYPCAGDSAGDDQEGNRFARTIASIHHAMDVLRAHAQIDHLTLLGIRVGAAFAMLAAVDEDGCTAPRVDALIALSPVVRGRSYLRELSLVQRQWLETAAPAVQQAHRHDDGVNVLGHYYPADLVDRLKALDLCGVAKSAGALPQSVLLVDTDHGDGAALKTVLHGCGVDADIHGFPEWSTTMVEGTRSRLPLNAIDSLTQWLAERAETQTLATIHSASAQACNPGNASVRTTANGVTERLVMIGPNRLAGVLSSATHTVSAQPETPALLIASTAANPRTADGRFAVRLAREVADLGFTTLRVDVNGIGDSGKEAPDDQSGIPYSDSVIEDLMAAASWLAAQGHREVIAFGVCSGAYAALHAAARTTSLAGVVAINPARFIWPRGMTLAEAEKQQTNSAKGYLASVRNGRKWRRLVRERRDLRPVLKALRRLVIARLRSPAMQIAQRFGWQPCARSAQGLMYELERRGVRTSLVYGEFDPGIDELARHFGPARRAFRKWRHVRVQTIRELDHSLYSASGTRAVIDLCVQTLTGWSAKQTRTAPACTALSIKARKFAKSTRVSDA